MYIATRSSRLARLWTAPDGDDRLKRGTAARGERCAGWWARGEARMSYPVQPTAAPADGEIAGEELGTR